MGKEILAIPEEHLADVIEVIRAGLKALEDTIDAVVEHALNKWCNEEEEYLIRLSAPIARSCYNCDYFHKNEEKKCLHPNFHINPLGPAGVSLDKGCELFQSSTPKVNNK